MKFKALWTGLNPATSASTVLEMKTTGQNDNFLISGWVRKENNLYQVSEPDTYSATINHKNLTVCLTSLFNLNMDSEGF
jgi:hypothetical protein